MRLKTLFACIFLTTLGQASAAYVPTAKDSGWVPLFNGTDLTGLYPHLQNGAWGQNPGNLITVHDSMIHFYQGKKKSKGDPNIGGILSTSADFSYYRCRVEYKHGDVKDDGWLGGDPYNSGLFFHAQPGGPVFPPGIECQLRRHWNSKANKPCSAAAGDCDQWWAGDFWILEGVQVTNREGKLSVLGGCCQPAYGTHKPDPELEGWNTMEIQVWSDSAFRALLNGQEMNRGSKATWQNPQGQRVALKQGRLQLELEGSEILFRNWEVQLEKRDPLYKTWYKEGCLDPEYQEYDKAANRHIASLCIGKTVSLSAAGPKAKRTGGKSAGRRATWIAPNPKAGTGAMPGELRDARGRNRPLSQ